MASPDFDDYRWLVSDQGREWLAVIDEEPKSLVAQSKRLRQQLSANRAHLILEQLALRRRAAGKFSAARRMFFTRRGLEQATGEGVSLFNASRFAGVESMADLCCGIGGDLLALGQQAPTVGVDRDPIAALLAEANCQACGVPFWQMRVERAEKVQFRDLAAWHLDPDRRPAGVRTAQLCWSTPSPAAVEEMWRACPHAAVKLAPAAQLPENWSAEVERQWIGSGRECRQQVIWRGRLAKYPGRRSVAVADRSGQAHEGLVGIPTADVSLATTIGRFVWEPHAAVLAADLANTLAEELSLRALGPEVAYFTSDHYLQHTLLRGFEVREILPLDRKRLRSALRQRRIGHLEIKKRAVQLDPAEWQKRLKCKGSESATLLIAPWQGRTVAIVAQPLAPASASDC